MQTGKLQIPSNHKLVNEQDIENCPYMQVQKAAEARKEAEVAKEKKEKKEKKPKGGCPFMSSEKKKNPSLESYPATFEIPFISPMKFLLSFKGLLSNDDADEKRQKFDSYPIYLQHSVFYDDETMKKARTLEMCHRFFVFDTFREKGNKYYNKGDFAEALKYYERALSCLKWLTYKKPEKKKKEVKVGTNLPSQEAGEVSTEKTEEKNEQEAILEDDDDDDKYSLLATYNDENVTLHDGEDVREEMDKDMRNSMLLQIYLNLAVTYLRLSHYSLANTALDDASKVSEKSTQILYRRSQVVACNMESRIEDLMKAKKDIELAIEMKKYEKLFNSEPGVLRILNLANADEAYIQQARFVEQRIRERRDFEYRHVRELIARAKEIQMIEERMRAEGKTPRESGEDNTSLSIGAEGSYNEYEIATEVVNKYIRIIEFYQESEKGEEQVKLARKEILPAKELLHEMTFVLNIDFKSYKENPVIDDILQDVTIDIEDPKIQRRLERLKRQKIKDLFEIKGQIYNFQVFKWAVDDYFKRKEKEQKAQEEQNKANQAAAAGQEKAGKSLFRNMFTAEFGLQLVVVGLLLAAFYVFNRNSSLLNGILFRSGK